MIQYIQNFGYNFPKNKKCGLAQGKGTVQDEYWFFLWSLKSKKQPRY